VTFPALLRRGGQELVTIALKGIGPIDWYQCGVVNKVSAEALCAVEASMGGLRGRFVEEAWLRVRSSWLGCSYGGFKLLI
jgi:hypothetical protein